EIDPVDPDLENCGASVARGDIWSQDPRQVMAERLIHPGCGRIAGERAQRLDVDHDVAKPQTALGSRARGGARQRKAECAKGGECAPASHGAGDHRVLFLPATPGPIQHNAQKRSFEAKPRSIALTGEMVLGRPLHRPSDGPPPPLRRGTMRSEIV